MPTSPPKEASLLTPGFLSIPSAARWADVSPKTVKRWMSKGLHFFQEGARTKVLIRPGDIEQFLTKRKVAKSSLDQMVDSVLEELQRGKVED
ncbi:MAG: helix-turn-helix domain-containing protein [Nitrospinae bacterium]|nr:helix-turn-helix domain-containing protein [Nitrospinota bacterium]